MITSTLVATTGVTLLLLAFFLNLTGIIKRLDWVYLAMNAVGAALSCYASILIHFLPFIILEGVWATVAAAGLARKIFVHEET